MTIREALCEYLILSTRASELDDAPCSCEEFHMCENCDERGKANSALRYHVTMWGERYADELAKREGILAEEETNA